MTQQIKSTALKLARLLLSAIAKAANWIIQQINQELKKGAKQ